MFDFPALLRGDDVGTSDPSSMSIADGLRVVRPPLTSMQAVPVWSPQQNRVCCNFTSSGEKHNSYPQVQGKSESTYLLCATGCESSV
ncbi:hypothetical protein GDO78_021031 [Eleutherodactylus coqui]|uniref:Uncharacterized protein n=1 Tax=Eleutherodactylus coqui TaxID=57060 RepID=A0A8J6E890_ELECQ|nr:hypothetical protein GDO78_021031 [Eleutherodactylus coqui]